MLPGLPVGYVPIRVNARPHCRSTCSGGYGKVALRHKAHDVVAARQSSPAGRAGRAQRELGMDAGRMYAAGSGASRVSAGVLQTVASATQPAPCARTRRRCGKRGNIMYVTLVLWPTSAFNPDSWWILTLIMHRSLTVHAHASATRSAIPELHTPRPARDSSYQHIWCGMCQREQRSLLCGSAVLVYLVFLHPRNRRPGRWRSTFCRHCGLQPCRTARRATAWPRACDTF